MVTYIPDKNLHAIFLDIDGVLIKGSRTRYSSSCVKNLRKIILGTGSRIILSSNHRLFTKHQKNFKNTLKKHQIDLEFFVGQTDFPENVSEYSKGNRERRTRLILKYLKDHPEISTWVAIDDLKLNLPKKNFVRTKNSDGLTKKKAQKVIDLFLEQQKKKKKISDTESKSKSNTKNDCMTSADASAGTDTDTDKKTRVDSSSDNDNGGDDKDNVNRKIGTRKIFYDKIINILESAPFMMISFLVVGAFI